MAKKPRLEVIQESDSGRNERFKDNKKGTELSRAQAVKEIKQGNIEGYHVRKVNGVATPVSNPNKSENDNLG